MIFGRELLIGIVLGVVLFYAYHRFAVPMGAPAWPITIGYNAAGSGVDRAGNPFNWTNPGR